MPETLSASAEKALSANADKPNSDHPAAEPGWQSPRFRRWVGVGVALCALVYFLRLDQVVSYYFVDDGYYITLAKALATGQGYRLINTPSGSLMPLYPPAFPVLLSIVFRLSPNFPDNLWLLKLCSIAAMFGVGVVSYYYCARIQKWAPSLALGMALVTALTPGLVLLATSSVMSECVYTFVFMLTLWVIEAALRGGKFHPGYLALGSMFCAFTWLTRSAAVALVAAVIVYLLKERLWRALLIYVIVFVALVAPWQLYARAHAPTAEQRKEQEGYIITSYAKSFWQTRAGDDNSKQATLRDLPARVLNNLTEIATQDMGRIFLAPLAEALQRQGASGVRAVLSLILFLLALIGFVTTAWQRISLLELVTAFSLGLIVLWPWDTFRYTLTLTPLLLFYLLMGVRVIARRWYNKQVESVAGASGQKRILLAALGLLCVISLAGHAHYLFLRYAASPLDQPTILRGHKENMALLDWVKRSLPRSEVLAAQNPPLVYLYTGNKTISAQNLGENLDTMQRFNVRHLVLNSLAPLPNPDLRGGKYKISYRVPGELNLYIVDFGPPGSQ